MASFNKVILMGNLTRDPEMRVTPNGHSICKLGLAVSRTFSTRDGERREETAFVDIDAFGKQAEVIAKYMRKGRPIMVEGRLKLDQWESNEGQKRSKLGVVLENFQFLGSRDDNQEGYESSSPPERGQSNTTGTIPADQNEDALDQDVPF
ncbi:MAG: single-stranded DNA-binding protein [Puniceicoccaceae bacterium]|nr:single-stranded DNA-binding protein [Puniceicoccaceae bacterium]